MASNGADFTILGHWVDARGAFFAGAVVEITEDSWRPLDAKMECHRTATYYHSMQSYKRAELFEHRVSGSVKMYRATAGPNKTLIVEMPSSNLKWTLVRYSPGIVVPDSLWLSFTDPEDEQMHTEDTDTRNRLPILVISGLILATAIGEAEVARAGHFRVADSLLLMLAIASGLMAGRLGLVYADTLAVGGASLASVVLQLAQAGLEQDDQPHYMSEDGVTLLLSTLLTLVTHCFMEVRTTMSWLVPASQVLCFLCLGPLHRGSPGSRDSSVVSEVRQVFCGCLLGALGAICWFRRWLDERAERSAWAARMMQEKRSAEQEKAQDRVHDVMKTQAQLEELGSRHQSPRRVRRGNSAEALGSTKVKQPLWTTQRSEPALRRDNSCSSPRSPRRRASAAASRAALEGIRAALTWRNTTTLTSFGPERPLQAPLPREVQVKQCLPGISPNAVLAAAMSGRRSSFSKVKAMAERIRSPDYSLHTFFQDCVDSFPELGLFFVPNLDSPIVSGHPAEVEYQRTIGALFAVYWLLRLDVDGDDGKKGFCFGVDADWRTVQGTSTSAKSAAGKPSSELTEHQKRQVFWETMDWAKFTEVVTDALSVAGTTEVDRIAAMLTLTSFHDIMKVQELCPVVQEEHAPYQGYEAGNAILDHDIALAYVLEHHGWMLPSFHALPRDAQAAVLFTQAKLQFNHGWFVQAEAPPGPMLSGFKRAASTAARGDIAFYFFHWLTDLAGAMGTPLGGAEMFVVKFPPAVLKAFLWSIPFLERLQDSTETAVVEDYLRARWRMALPSEALPVGSDAVALLRLAAMSGNSSQTAVDAFRSLDCASRQLLSREMAATGLSKQRYECPAVHIDGGPAFLVYYGPALLQRCEDDPKQMRLALYALRAVYRAGRLLWPSRPDMKDVTVTLEIGQLKSLSIDSVHAGEAGDARKVWALVRQSDLEASCKLLSSREINALVAKQVCYTLLDLDEDLDYQDLCFPREVSYDYLLDEADRGETSEAMVSAVASYAAFSERSLSTGYLQEPSEDLRTPLLRTRSRAEPAEFPIRARS